MAGGHSGGRVEALTGEARVFFDTVADVHDGWEGVPEIEDDSRAYEGRDAAVDFEFSTGQPDVKRRTEGWVKAKNGSLPEIVKVKTNETTNLKFGTASATTKASAQ